MSYGITHLAVNVAFLILMILFITNIFPDIDHFSIRNKDGINRSLTYKAKNLIRGYLGLRTDLSWTRRGVLHNPYLPLTLLYISLIWLIHLKMDGIL